MTDLAAPRNFEKLGDLSPMAGMPEDIMVAGAIARVLLRGPNLGSKDDELVEYLDFARYLRQTAGLGAGETEVAFNVQETLEQSYGEAPLYVSGLDRSPQSAPAFIVARSLASTQRSLQVPTRSLMDPYREQPPESPESYSTVLLTGSVYEMPGHIQNAKSHWQDMPPEKTVIVATNSAFPDELQGPNTGEMLTEADYVRSSVNRLLGEEFTSRVLAVEPGLTDTERMAQIADKLGLASVDEKLLVITDGGRTFIDGGALRSVLPRYYDEHGDKIFIRGITNRLPGNTGHEQGETHIHPYLSLARILKSLSWYLALHEGEQIRKIRQE